MQRLVIEGYTVEGISIAGHGTCVMFPSLNLAFDIGRCPPLAVSQDFLFISHAHMDHIGGLPLYIATRGRRRMRPPTVFVPTCLADLVRRLFEVHRTMDQSDRDHKLVPLEVGEEYELGKDLRVRAFRTYQVVPSQTCGVSVGVYVIYKLKKKLKDENAGLSGKELSSLRKSGIEITNAVLTPEVAFTGDTMSDFILDLDNADVLNAKILLVEDIDAAINRLPPSFRSRVYALKEGF